MRSIVRFNSDRVILRIRVKSSGGQPETADPLPCRSEVMAVHQITAAASGAITVT